MTTTAALVADQFASSELGAVYDFTDPTTLYTDAARTTLVSSDGDTVRGFLDVSGNGNHIGMASGTGFTYRIRDGVSCVELDASSGDYILANTRFGLPANGDYTFVIATEVGTLASEASGSLIDLGSSQSSAGAGVYYHLVKNTTAGGEFVVAHGNGNRNFGTGTGAYHSGEQVVMTSQRPTGGTHSQNTLRIDGVAAPVYSTANPSNTLGSTVAKTSFGAQEDGSNPYDGFWYGILIRNSVDTTDRDQAEDWAETLMATSGVAGAASGSLDFTGSADGAVLVAVAGSGALDITGAATADVSVAGEGGGALDISGSAAADVGIAGEASGALPIAGASTGSVAVSGAAGGALPITGAGTGSVEGTVVGAASGGLDIAGSSSGAVAVSGAASGTLPLTGSAGSQPNDPTIVRPVEITAAYVPGVVAITAKYSPGVVALTAS